MGTLIATVRGRLTLLLILASAPLVVVSVVVALRNSSLLAERSRMWLSAQRDTVQLRQKSFLSEGERLLRALSLGRSLLDDDPATCSAELARLVAISGERYAAISVFDGQRRFRCGSAGGPFVPASEAQSVVHAAYSDGGFVVGRFFSGATGRPVVLPLALSTSGGGGFLVAAVNEQRLVAMSVEQPPGSLLSAWVLPAGGPPLRLAGDSDSALPEHEFAAVAESDEMMAASGRDGVRYGYIAGALLGGSRILLALPTEIALTPAELALGRRAAELSLALLVGFVLVAFGAEMTLGRPLSRVAAAVGRWRAGGRFDAGSARGGPQELLAMAQSFSEATEALNLRERQLRDASTQQDLLMQEIHHRVKNNLQVVASLLNLQAGRIREPAARAEFHAARDRIRALATLHRHLYAYGEVHTINMRGFLEELCHQLLLAMGETPGGGRIALTIEASELRISSDQAVPMALLVTEVVSNAVKYAFPGGRSGHIAVRLTTRVDAAGEETARLVIEDDGVGIPAGKADTESGPRDGLGLRLIRGFAQQLGARLEVIQDHGSHYVVELPLQRRRDPEETGEEA